MSAGVSFSVLDLNYPTAKLPHAVTPPRSLFYICFCRQRTLSTVRLGNSRCTARQSKCKRHQESPIPTIKTCGRSRSQSRSRPDDAKFPSADMDPAHNQIVFPTIFFFTMSWQSDWSDANGHQRYAILLGRNRDTSRPRPKRISMLLVPDRNTGPTLRANHDTETGASPNCILFARPLTTQACSHVRTKIVLNQ